MKVLKQYKNTSANILWGNLDRARQIILIALMKTKFEFVSPFPEGDGICFNLTEPPQDLTPEQEIELAEWFINAFDKIGIDDFLTNLEVPKSHMLIRKVSELSGKTHARLLPVTQEQFNKWNSGTHIQVAFPNLNASDREFIMTGITQEEWDNTFSKEDDIDEQLDDEFSDLIDEEDLDLNVNPNTGSDIEY